MSKHSSIFSVSIPSREQQTDADKMVFPQPRRGAGEGVRERERATGVREKGTWVEWDRFWKETRHRVRLTRTYNCNYLKGSIKWLVINQSVVGLFGVLLMTGWATISSLKSSVLHPQPKAPIYCMSSDLSPASIPTLTSHMTLSYHYSSHYYH